VGRVRPGSVTWSHCDIPHDPGRTFSAAVVPRWCGPPAVSGPVSSLDAPTTAASPSPTLAPTLEIRPSRQAMVGTVSVRRALPRRERRTVGAWCFADHFGPAPMVESGGLEIGPHPHIGLHTVTWLLAGEVLHHDSLGSEQLIRPGELNLMTAGRGVAHAEESPTPPSGEGHGVQLWVAQPEATRHDAPAFEHHGALPQVELHAGSATVLVGSFGGLTSPARADTQLVGLDIDLRAGQSLVALEQEFEYALMVLAGSISIGDDHVEPGALAYLGGGRDEISLLASGPTRGLLLGGVPFSEPILMWWNFVARSRSEMDQAYQDWESGQSRFPKVVSKLARVGAPRPSWMLGP
jgi:redox-sensitive bicupin YhaK (pirin superfamily)